MKEGVFLLSLQFLFPQLHGFHLLSCHREPTCLVLICERVIPSALCPVCETPARRIHSRYQRTVWDLSVQNVQVLLHLHVRKFYCDQPECPRRIFAERLPQVTTPHGRFTIALRQVLAHLGQEHGGAPGARSAKHLGIQATPRTILRLLHALPLPPIAPPRIIGIDEWAWKRRERYGAIVVDLERKLPIALLAGRSQEMVRPWLEDHPTIEMVARDRSKEFAAAITAALPKAKHVADRWHLAKNLTEHLDRVVSARWKHLSKHLRPAEALLEPIPVPPRHRRHRQSAGEERYEQALALMQAGVSPSMIAQRLGVGERTIQRWLTQQHGPYAGPRKQRRGPFDWTTAYLHERWNAGERNGTVLWEELKAQGYTGSLRSLYRRLGRWRDGPRRRGLAPAAGPVPPRSPLEDLTPARVIGWIIARPETLTPETAAQLEDLCQLDPVIAQARNLAQRWLGFIRTHTSEGIDVWLHQMRDSGLPAFVAFARSVEQDKAAILAGLTLPYSTSPVEGHIHRLKLIKRQAYGRASLPYLQRRFFSVA